jgi:hypothetical protein
MMKHDDLSRLTNWRYAHSFRARLPKAVSVELEAETPFQSFAPMELVATASSLAAMVAKHGEGKASSSTVMFFPTDRSNQVKMFDELPQVWADAGPSSLLSGKAQRGELFALQLGVWNRGTKNLTLAPTDIVWTALKASSSTQVRPVDGTYSVQH